jgi:hypothetical protein
MTHTYSKLDQVNDFVGDVVYSLIEKGIHTTYRFIKNKLNETSEKKALRLQKNSGLGNILGENWYGNPKTPHAEDYLREIRGNIIFAKTCKNHNIPINYYEGTDKITFRTKKQFMEARANDLKKHYTNNPYTAWTCTDELVEKAINQGEIKEVIINEDIKYSHSN